MSGDHGRTPPSGEQYEISHGTSEATVTQVGATLRRLRFAGRSAIDGFGVDERASDGRGQVLAPWPNRLTDGKYTFGRRECQAPLNELSRHDAIHGLVRWLDWTCVEHTASSVTLRCTVRPQPGYEWHLDLEITYALDAAGLRVTLDARNADVEAAPFGVGFHPYLTLGRRPIDGLMLTVPATADASWDHDFRTPRHLGSTRLDNAFGSLVRGADGCAVARLEDPANGAAVELWVDGAFRYLMVYTADAVARPERHRMAVAVEPMTCPPEALRTGIDLVTLEPGATWQGSWGIRDASTR
ncbi:aldose 1-epimerase family protein [Mumia sp. DW29H23]|uniref:aldose 1-epimerase family protein n=1 Tax=Mumia sp. DW29H23 TaxID=3421241 RepID=UPI003D684024